MLRKTNGFINIFGVLALAALSVASLALFSANKAKNIVENELNKQIELNLGAVVSSTALSDTIGTFRINVNDNFTRVNDQLINSTSVDPGHLHTASSVSSTITIAKGGTGTSTLPTADGQLPIVSASTTSFTYTNAVPDCVSATSSKLLFTSSTKTWSCGTDTATPTTSTVNGLFLKTSSTLVWDGLAYDIRGTSSIGLTTTTVEAYMATTTIPGGLMQQEGGLRITSFIRISDQTSEYKLYYGGTVLGFANMPGGGADEFWIETVIVNRGATGNQIGVTISVSDNQTLGGVMDSDIRTALIDSSVNQTLNITIKTLNGAAASVPILEFYIIEPL